VKIKLGASFAYERLRPCVDCYQLTPGRVRLRRVGWRGFLDRFHKRYVPLCVVHADNVLRASFARRPGR
jgi:hypothetical protein